MSIFLASFSYGKQSQPKNFKGYWQLKITPSSLTVDLQKLIV